MDTAIWTQAQDALQDLEHSASQTLAVIQKSSWDDVQTGYVRLVTEYIPGPLSLSYFVPFILLPLALMIPPNILSQRQLCYYFLPPIYAAVIHAWFAMGGVDVMSVDGLLWTTLLLAFKDVRNEFRRLMVSSSSDGYTRAPVLQGTSATSGASTKRTNKAQVKSQPAIMKHETAQSQQSDIPKGYSRTDEEDVFEQPYPTDLFERLKWVLTLVISTRFHGWTTGSAKRDARQMQVIRRAPSRTRYVISIVPIIVLLQAFSLPLVIQLGIFDAQISSLVTPTKATSKWSPFSKISIAPPQTVQFLQNHVPSFILRPLTSGLFVLCILYGGYYQLIPLAVASNYLFGIPKDSWSPQNLPDHFGSILTVFDHGVGGLWGRWWHQHMRQMVSGPGLAAADSLGPTEKRISEEQDSGRRDHLSNCRYALQVISGFFFSGITHMGLVPTLAPGAMGLRLRIASFFWVQAVGVILERLVASWLGWTKEHENHSRSVMSRIIFSKWLLRPLRLAWVVAWLCLTLPLLEQPLDRLGWWKIYPPPGTPPQLQYYMRGEWIP